MRELPKAGEKYRHFKGTVYEVIAVARHSETMEELVIYRDTGKEDAVFARPMTMFMSGVDRMKYPGIAAEYRFTRVDETNRQAVSSMENFSGKAAVIREEEVPKKEELPNIEKIPRAEEPPEQEELSEPAGVPAELLRFLDEDDYEEKLLILDEIKPKLTDGMLSAMGASLDLALNEGPMEEKLSEIRNYLTLQLKYDGKHLRERNS